LPLSKFACATSWRLAPDSFQFQSSIDEKGNIEGVVLSGRDVTDLKRLEEQLIQAEKLAAMGQMLAASPMS